jgi:glucose/arabinose dehydrogenase
MRGSPSRRAQGHRRVVARVVIVALGIVSVTVPATRAAARVTAKFPELRLDRVSSIADTTAFATRPGSTNVYLAVQSGTVVALGAGGTTRTVLDLTNRTRSGGEQGLLGLTFDPDGTHLYVHYSGRTAGETVVEEYAFRASGADPASRRVLLTQAQPQSNHNGGQLAFGPDGLLYVGLGDGGGAGDQGSGHADGGNGQSLQTLLGKILRIDPRAGAALPYTVPADNPFVGRDGRDEIWVYGLRNPWRFSFDRKNGALWIADVGQNEFEEIDRLPAGQAAGANLGWNVFEGDVRFRDGTAPGAVAPVATLSHDDGNCSVIGGHVYRGRAIPALRGWYLYTDFCEGTLRALRIRASGRVRHEDLGVHLDDVSSFGEDADGELYLLSQSEGVFRLRA